LLITDRLVNSLLILGVYSASTWTPKTTVGYTVTHAFIRVYCPKRTINLANQKKSEINGIHKQVL